MRRAVANPANDRAASSGAAGRTKRASGSAEAVHRTTPESNFNSGVDRGPAPTRPPTALQSGGLALVTIGLVTWNSAPDVARCLDGIRAQQHQPIELLVGDNASADGTRALLEARTTAAERRYFPANLGFSAAHNALIRESRGAYYVTLNPDVVLDAGFVARPGRRPGRGAARRQRHRQAAPRRSAGRPRFDRDRDAPLAAARRSRRRRGRSRPVRHARRRLRRVGGGGLLPPRDAGRRRDRRRGVRRGLLRLPRGRRSGLAGAAPRLGRALRARGHGHARPARHPRTAVGAARGDQPLRRPQPVPAAAEEPDRRAGGALRRRPAWPATFKSSATCWRGSGARFRGSSTSCACCRGRSPSGAPSWRGGIGRRSLDAWFV